MRIIEPDERFRVSFLEAWDEFDAEDERGAECSGAFGFTRQQCDSAAGFAAMCARRRLDETDPPEGFVPATMLWAVDGDRWLGRVSVRHELNDHLIRFGGHIGYAVRSSARRRGIATILLRVGLGMLNGIGVGEALILCAEDNEGSRRVIETNGGELEKIAEGLRHYRVATRQWGTRRG